MVKLINIGNSKKNIGKGVGYLMSLMALHREAARKLGIYDKKVEEYSILDAEVALTRSDRHHYLIESSGVVVGLLNYTLDGGILFINQLYIEEEYRLKGIGRQVIDYLVLKYRGFKIGLNCWYELEACGFYDKLGFKKEYIRYGR